MKQHFVRNVDLTAEIIRCQATMIVSDPLARMLWLMVERYSLNSNWRYYSFLEDMKGEAILQLVKCNEPRRGANDYRPNILKFDVSYAERVGKKPNPFAYATTIITNVFRRYVKLEGALQRFRDDCLIEEGSQPSFKRQSEDELGRSAEPIPIRTRTKRGPRPKIAAN